MSSMLVCLDFDGTLAELNPDPYAVRIHPGAEGGRVFADTIAAAVDAVELERAEREYRRAHRDPERIRGPQP